MSGHDSCPTLSIILPVSDAPATLDRAINSVRRQTFNDWELLVVDRDCSDESAAELWRWTADDDRIRIVRLEEPGSAGAARNEALRRARGKLITYLDGDDEYCPDYLGHVTHFACEADVLVFAYEIAQPVARVPRTLARFDWSLEEGESWQRLERVDVWEPARVRDYLFGMNIAKPLGVAHRRELWNKMGGFNELVWAGEDWDYWKRLARAGATFLFVPFKSGRYRVRRSLGNDVPRLTTTQREVVVTNWKAGRPIFSSGPRQTSVRQARKLVYISPHCLIDPTSGAAVATAHGLRLLQALGFECQAFCGSRLDSGEDVEMMLTRHQIDFERQQVAIDNTHLPMLVASLNGVVDGPLGTPLHVSIFPNELPNATAFYRACEIFLDSHRPDAVLTYGGDPLANTFINLAKNRDIPVVFWLHNFAYHDALAFVKADYVIVPSQFNRQFYWDHLRLACQVLPLVIDWRRAQVAQPQPRFLTLVNPQRVKGLCVFARIAQVLSTRRPDIPLLVMAGRSQTGWQEETGIDLGRLNNVTIRPSVPDVREFYAVTKLLLMPSLWNESFGLVAAEAMLNGIPVLASNRGALPETVGDAGFLFDIPACYTPDSRDVPTVEEVDPWVKTIIRLWDDAAEYERWSQAARHCAQQWHPDRLAHIYREFFGSITHQPGPPLLPRGVGAT